MTPASNESFLVLADGTVFAGTAFGAAGIAVGEAVFTTSMTGYQEVLTDPSYAGQIVTMTAPHIGNVGTNPSDDECIDHRPRLRGVVLRDPSCVASNWRAQASLEQMLVRHNIVGLSGVDTRALTRHLREHGSQNAAMGQASVAELREHARGAPSTSGIDLASTVTTARSYVFTEPTPAAWREGPARQTCDLHVVAVDFGIKKSILHCLVDVGCKVTVVPASTPPAQILALSPDGLFLSNGPGDPSAVRTGIETIATLAGKVPIFGICLGHQLLALALGAKTYKLKFGHRGANQPVMDIETRKVEITTQNHGFCVDPSTLPKGARVTHVHLNDQTCEGIAYDSLQAFSVQFHPEASAGPHDSRYLFERFRSLMINSRTSA